MIDPRAIYQLQNVLAAGNYYTGALDNDPGPLTRAAVLTLKTNGQPSVIRDFQAMLNLMGVSPQLVEDGLWAGKTDAAWKQVVDESKLPVIGVTITHSRGLEWPSSRILSNPNCKWTVEVSGPDLILRGKATCFGGYNDPQDDGTTASGFNTKGHPLLMACSLPMHMSTVKNLQDSPLPFMHFGMDAHGRDLITGPHVIVTWPDGSKSPLLPVIDLGPAVYTGNVIDLTQAAARLYARNATSTNFSAVVEARVIGGAKFIFLKTG